MSSPVQLINGGFQDAEGNPLDGGYLEFELNQDSSVNGLNICAGVTIKILLDTNGDVATSPSAQNMWGNDVLSPINSYYRVTGFSAKGQICWGPNNQQVVGNGTFDLSTWIPNQVFSWTPPITSIELETDGTPNTVQTLLDLESGTNITLTDNGDGSVTIDSSATGFILKVNGTQKAPTPHSTINLSNGFGITLTDDGSGDIRFDGLNYKAANPGWFLGGQSYAPIADNTGGFFGTNVVYAVELFLDAAYTLSSMAAFCITGSNGAFTAGLYDSTGAKIVDAGANAFSLAGSQRYLHVALTGNQVGPGKVYFAFAAPTGANGSLLCHVPEQWLTQLLNGIDLVNPQSGPTRIGTAANALVGGNALPATLGALTPLDHTSFVPIPAVLFVAA